ncbi:MAG: LptF/LptG family permease [Rhizobiaceae bacterium]|nr:LptF/LptG family permease [Rhizobiaceae bacterium]
MKLIERYIFGKALYASLIILGALVGVVWIVQALREIDIIASNGQTILTYFTITIMLVPNIALAIVPVALMLSAIHTINGMNSNSELVVVTASGCSNWTIAKPLLVLALICSLITGLVAHLISPYSLQHVKKLVTEMRADLVSVVLQEGSFNSIGNGLTFHVAERGASGLLKGILISDDREEDSSAIFSAKEGVVVRTPAGSFLTLKDGEIQQTSKKDGSVTLIKYQSYAFDLSSFSGNKQAGALRPKERPTWELFNPDPDDKIYQARPNRFGQEIHERFSEMLWPFANIFIILAFSGQARSSRQSFASAITSAAIVLVVARAMGFSAVTALKTDPAAVIYVYALPLSCIAFGAYFVFSNKPAELPKSAGDRIDRLTGNLSEFFSRYFEAYKQFRRRLAGVKA